jgi:hypothetical protein
MSHRTLAIMAALAFAPAAVARGGEIHACVHKNTGALRIVSGTATGDSSTAPLFRPDQRSRVSGPSTSLVFRSEFLKRRL